MLVHDFALMHLLIHVRGKSLIKTIRKLAEIVRKQIIEKMQHVSHRHMWNPISTARTYSRLR